MNGSAPGLIVPDNPAQHPEVAGGNPVVIVQIQRQQRADIHTENQMTVHMFRKHTGIQPMQALHNDHRVGMQRQLVSAPLPLSCQEVEAGQLHFFSLQKFGKILTKQLRIQSIDMLQILLSIRPGRNLVSVKIVIIQTHQNRLFPVHPELGCQSVGRGGFSGGTWPGQHHSLGAALADHIRNLRIPLLMQGFVHPNQFPDSSGNCQIVQVGNRCAFHKTAPAFPFVENTEKPGHGGHLRAFFRLIGVGINQNKAPVRRNDIPDGEIVGTGEHFSIIIVRKVPIGIDMKLFLAPPAKKPGFIILSTLHEVVNRLLKRHTAAGQRDCLGNQLLHPFLQGVCGECICPFHGDENTGSQCTAGFCRSFRPKLAQRQKYHKLRGSGVYLTPQGIFVAKKGNHSPGGCHSTTDGMPFAFQILLSDGDIVQRKNLAGKFGRQRPQAQLFLIQIQFPDKIQKGLPGLRRNTLTFHRQIHIDTPCFSFDYSGLLYHNAARYAILFSLSFPLA